MVSGVHLRSSGMGGIATSWAIFMSYLVQRQRRSDSHQKNSQHTLGLRCSRNNSNRASRLQDNKVIGSNYELIAQGQYYPDTKTNNDFPPTMPMAIMGIDTKVTLKWASRDLQCNLFLTKWGPSWKCKVDLAMEERSLKPTKATEGKGENMEATQGVQKSDWQCLAFTLGFQEIVSNFLIIGQFRHPRHIYKQKVYLNIFLTIKI